MPRTDAPARSPWTWVPTLYFAQGIPYVLAMTASVIMYKNLGIDNAEIALYTSWLYLPWVVKPLWSPLVDMVRTKRGWTVAMQLLMGGAMAGVALLLPLPGWFASTLLVFGVMAFFSATHDIAADGFYMLGLPTHQQAAFVGVRSTFYRVATITGQGLLVMLAGRLHRLGADWAASWAATFLALAALYLGFALYHRAFLPRPAADRPARAAPGEGVAGGFLRIFLLFLRKPRITAILAFLLLYRFAEAQLVKLVSPFLLDPRAKGGLGLSTEDVGLVYGIVGVIALTAGGLLGGWLISRHGLRRCLWPMVFIMHLPDLAFVFLSQVQPSSLPLITACVAVEQFGYGLGFTAYMMFMILIADGEHKTAHYAICTGFMALGMMLPGMASGWIQERLGYPGFFTWVMISTIPGFIVPALVVIPAGFGRKGGDRP